MKETDPIPAEPGDADPFFTRRGPIAWMATNRVAANILMAVLVLGGIVMGLQVKEEVFPEFDMDWVIVRMGYPGASPAEAEQGIVLAIEEEVRGLDGVKQVVSSAGEGYGAVYVELEGSAEPDRVLSDIKNGIDR